MFTHSNATLWGMRIAIFLTVLLGGTLSACALTPPLAEEEPKELSIHGDRRVDPYFWMKDRENPKVIRYLEAENEYLEKVLAPQKALREKLYEEMRSRIKEDDSTVPFFEKGYFYYSRFEKGKEYPIYARRKGSLEAPEEILIDVNKMADGQEFIDVGFPSISPDQSKMIYAKDLQGRRIYSLHIVDIASKREIRSPIEETSGSVEWANDSETFFYTKQDPETLRPKWLYRDALKASAPELLYEETDETFYFDISKSRTDDFLFAISSSTLSTEWRMLDANDPKAKLTVILPREKKHEYVVEDGGDAFYVITNWKAKNFRMMKAPRRPSKKQEWKEVIPHKGDVLLEGVSFFKSHYVLQERFNGLSRLQVVNRESGEKDFIAFPDEVYDVSAGANPEYDSHEFRYRYESLNSAPSVFDYDVQTKTSAVRKVLETPNLNLKEFESERVWVKARDGRKIPVSLLYKKPFSPDGSTPILIEGYGAYGLNMDPTFGSDIFSLVDRGFVYAIAHVRGGSEMGRYWYEEGRQLQKMNTFYDFIDVTEALVKMGFADRDRVYAIGGSAGGLLMGALSNLRADLYHGIVAAVPFVDVLTTMLDSSIPLTAGEYDEWGDPRKPEFYRYMKQYSPYDNVEEKKIPNLLVLSGLHDSQVQYWEPTKWVAKLRRKRVGEELLLLHTEMEAGHDGASGRFEALKQKALIYAFLLRLSRKE